MTTVDDLIDRLREADNTIAKAKGESSQVRKALVALRNSGEAIETAEKQRIGQALNRKRAPKQPVMAPKPKK